MLSNYGENNVIIGERTYKCEEMELADEGFIGWDSTIWDMFCIDWVLLMSLRYNILQFPSIHPSIGQSVPNFF